MNRARRVNKKCHHSQAKKTKGGQHEHRVWVSKQDILPDVHLPRVDLVLHAAAHRVLHRLVALRAALAHLGEERDGALVRVDGLAHEGGEVLALGKRQRQF